MADVLIYRKLVGLDKIGAIWQKLLQKRVIGVLQLCVMENLIPATAAAANLFFTSMQKGGFSASFSKFSKGLESFSI